MKSLTMPWAGVGAKAFGLHEHRVYGSYSVGNFMCLFWRISEVSPAHAGGRLDGAGHTHYPQTTHWKWVLGNFTLQTGY